MKCPENAMKSYFRTSKMADGHPKWPTAILSKIKKKNSYQYEMARNALESEYSGIQNGRRRLFCYFFKKRVPYRYEMVRNAIERDFRTSKIAASGHFVNKIHKIKLWYRSEMVWNAIKSDFWTYKMAAGGHLKKNIYKKSCASDLNNVRTDCWPTRTWYKFTFGQYIYRQVCWEPGNIHCVRPCGRIHTFLLCLGLKEYEAGHLFSSAHVF